jgi:hypothetical protein
MEPYGVEDGGPSSLFLMMALDVAFRGVPFEAGFTNSFDGESHGGIFTCVTGFEG